MAVTAKMVKELREKTGAGMLDCKKALVEVDGDMDKAIVVLREKGLAKAAKKAGRIAAEGLVVTKTSEDNKKAVVLEINSETDFVAKNEMFQVFVSEVANIALDVEGNSVEALLGTAWPKEVGKTVKDVLTEKISVIGENLNIRRFEVVTAPEGIVADYIHAGGRIGVLVKMSADIVNDAIKECTRNIAMQVAAITPKYVRREEISGDYIENEKEILKSQAKNENPDKPDAIIEKNDYWKT